MTKEEKVDRMLKKKNWAAKLWALGVLVSIIHVIAWIYTDNYTYFGAALALFFISTMAFGAYFNSIEEEQEEIEEEIKLDKLEERIEELEEELQ